jgi:hypothetical protein
MLRRLHARLVLLLAAVVIAALVAAVAAFAISTRETNAARMARALHAQVLAADALLAMDDRAAARELLYTLEIEWRETSPIDERPALLFLQRTEALVGARLHP